jgi:hypothetical protein
MSATAKDLIRLLEMFLIRDHGVPAILQCDQQSIFMSNEFSRYLMDKGIKRRESTVEHHQAAVESAISVLRVQMRAATDSVGLGWVDALPWCQLAANRAISQRGEPNPTSPAMKVFVCQPPIPLLDPKTRVLGHTPTTPTDTTTTNRISVTSMMDTYRETRAISAGQNDKGRIPSKVTVGSFVAVPSGLANIAVTSFEDNKALKSRAIYVGPFKTMSQLPGDNFMVDMGTGAMGFYHVSQLKLLPQEAGQVEKEPDQPSSLLWPDGKPKIKIIDRIRTKRGTQQYLVHFWGQHNDRGLWVTKPEMNKGDHIKVHQFHTRQRQGIPSFTRGKLVLDLEHAPVQPFTRTNINDPVA